MQLYLSLVLILKVSMSVTPTLILAVWERTLLFMSTPCAHLIYMHMIRAIHLPQIYTLWQEPQRLMMTCQERHTSCYSTNHCTMVPKWTTVCSIPSNLGSLEFQFGIILLMMKCHSLFKYQMKLRFLYAPMVLKYISSLEFQLAEIRRMSQDSRDKWTPLESLWSIIKTGYQHA